jgi:hypothetical protein
MLQVRLAIPLRFLFQELLFTVALLCWFQVQPGLLLPLATGPLFLLNYELQTYRQHEQQSPLIRTTPTTGNTSIGSPRATPLNLPTSQLRHHRSLISLAS